MVLEDATKHRKVIWELIASDKYMFTYQQGLL